MVYFPDKRQLEKATGYKIKEQYGMGVVNPNGVARAKTVNTPLSHGYNEFLDRGNNGIKTGQQTICLNSDRDRIDIGTLIVVKNGISIYEGEDWEYNPKIHAIELKYPIKEDDDYIEVSCRYHPHSALKEVILLPRFDMTDDQLIQLMPDNGDIFSIDKLLKYNNSDLITFASHKAKSIHTWIDKDGIKGRLKIEE